MALPCCGVLGPQSVKLGAPRPPSPIRIIFEDRISVTRRSIDLRASSLAPSFDLVNWNSFMPKNWTASTPTNSRSMMDMETSTSTSVKADGRLFLLLPAPDDLNGVVFIGQERDKWRSCW